MVKKLKKLVGSFIKIVIYYSKCMKIASIHIKGNACVIFIATPTHGNLGDHAIVYSQYSFFTSLNQRKNIVEFSREQYEQWHSKLSGVLNHDDIIVIDGGGSMGTLWIEEEEKMRDIVTRFSENKVFIFPQTAYFSSDDYGENELAKSYEAYQKNSQLIIFARDERTYALLAEKMPRVKCQFTPDMVMYIQNAHEDNLRQGCLFCLRKDSERIQEENLEEKLRISIEKLCDPVQETSTLVPDPVWKYERERELKKKWKEFSSAKLVITDRLHGMIFSAITGTPCIALDNASHKVHGGFQWISYLPYIKYCDNVGQVETIATELLALPPQNYNVKPLIPYFEQMKETVKNAIKDK